jgi:hypothetical protein
MGEILMARKKGRPKQEGSREANGRLQREPKDISKRDTSPASIRRIREAAFKAASDPLWGTEIGKLNLEGQIDDIQLEAGRKWSVAREAYDRAMGFKRAKAMTFGAGAAGTPPDPDSEIGQEISQREERDISNYTRAENSLSCFGKLSLDAVNDLCIEDKPLEWVRRQYAGAGLTCLAYHWGIIKPDKK